MMINFFGKTNKNYVMVNTAIFHLKDGGTITLDRGETEYTIENGNLSMVWNNIYLWEINGMCVFDAPIYPLNSEDMMRLLEDSWVELELEDDADADYQVTEVEWTIVSDNGQTHGSDRKVSFHNLQNDNEFIREFVKRLDPGIFKVSYDPVRIDTHFPCCAKSLESIICYLGMEKSFVIAELLREDGIRTYSFSFVPEI